MENYEDGKGPAVVLVEAYSDPIFSKKNLPASLLASPTHNSSAGTTIGFSHAL